MTGCLLCGAEATGDLCERCSPVVLAAAERASVTLVVPVAGPTGAVLAHLMDQLDGGE